MSEQTKWVSLGDYIEQQLLRGGLRLAHVLNSIYDPSYGK